MAGKVSKSEEEWRKQLTPEQYRVTREAGTEPAFTGKYYAHKDKGLYRCVGCGALLFRSEQKYDSGTGWPSYWTPAEESAVETAPDLQYGMNRTEVKCAACTWAMSSTMDRSPPACGTASTPPHFSLKRMIDSSLRLSGCDLRRSPIAYCLPGAFKRR